VKFKVNDKSEVTCSGSVFQMRDSATGKVPKPMEVNQTAGTIRSSEVEDRGPKNVMIRHVSNTDKLPQILWYVASQSMVRQEPCGLCALAHVASVN